MYYGGSDGGFQLVFYDDAYPLRFPRPADWHVDFSAVFIGFLHWNDSNGAAGKQDVLVDEVI